MTLLDRPDVVLDGDMADVLDSRCALLVQRRTLSGGLLDAVAAVDLEAARPLRLSAGRADAGAAFRKACVAAGYPAALAADVAALAERFGAVTASFAVSMRLEPVETDACRRFHADYVTVRLLVTYAGRGTEWRHVDDDRRIGSIATGDVALLKGRLLLDPPMVLHRSPPIAALGERRLLLALDAVP